MIQLSRESNEAIAQISEAYQKLLVLEPEHPLLKFLDEVRPGSFKYSLDEQIWQEFLQAYSPTGRPSEEVRLSNYYAHLQQALERYGGVRTLG